MTKGQCITAAFSMLAILIANNASAEVVIRPGERVYVSGDYVSCSTSGGSQPAPPPPKQRERITVGVNYRCLQNIQPTDGRSIASAAYRCEDNNPEKRYISGRTCETLHERTDYRLADEVINKANTVIHEHQKNTVRSAATERTYLCEI
jgi:hypothetical protein